ncbi:scavenger receptor cysteine-rich type 1 protein M130-like [Scomber japonicus]|uniref:scavenger receptor cysteine-rich type 1 protein M130-like n=1 Tax=Scomber japonicus TaxID=13676 RepID=UPI0023050ED1|nr:scavenger receptor cysteine-rich type 1 protein M130-like [Scomber japonicus]
MDLLLMLLLLLWSSGLQAEDEHQSTDLVRLVGGASRCAGTLEVKLGEWRPVSSSDWTLKKAAVACRELDCGSAVSTGSRNESSDRPVWRIDPDCLQSGSTLRDCALSYSSSSIVVELTCSDSVRLVNGASLCSGRLEVKSEQSWSSVCEADFDQQDAEVVCRELGCGTPSVLQGALYGEVEAPMWTKEFQCGGNESALLDCRRSDSTRRTCSPGKAVGLTCSEPFRLVGGASRCAGRLEVKQGEWRPLRDYDGTPKDAAVACRELDCGSAVSTGSRNESSVRPAWEIRPNCLQAGSALRECVSSHSSSSMVELTCSDSVRLVNGTSLCSGRLEVKSEQSWSSVCEADFDQQDAEVVCRELGCGAPSVLQGALYGEVEAPMWTKEFQCGGNESALLDCRRSDSARRTCSPGKAVGLTCSPESVRLVGGASRCAGTLEVKQGEWRPVTYNVFRWTLKEAAVACRELDCGSAVSTGSRKESSDRPAWWIRTDCVQAGSTLRDCVLSDSSSSMVELTCSDSVRLVNGTSLCSGRLEVKSEQSWSSVCEADFDQQDAEVVCRELDCGAPSVLQGALYGEVEAPMWTNEFQCGGNESALLDCRRSDSARRTCSPGKAVGLTCSETVRLVGGASRCAGTLEVKQGVWRPVSDNDWTLKEAAVACGELDCGSAVSTGSRKESSHRPVWTIRPNCLQSGSTLRDCVSSDSSSSMVVELTCSDSVRLVNGTSLCSGRLEVKSEQSWSSVCEADFDQQDAEVVCRELGCGTPSVLQGALYGEVEAPMWTKEFQCGGNESALLDCRRSDSARRTCSPGKAVGLTCSGPVRLVGGASRCAGTLEVKRGEWRPVRYYDWTLKEAAVVCRELDCGSAVSTGSRYESLDRPVLRIRRDCLRSGSALRDCVSSPGSSSFIVELTCSDLLLQPIISVSPTLYGVSGAQQQGFQVLQGSSIIIRCSVQPQYPGGSFHLTFSSSNTTYNYTQPAVNHSADFLFLAADPAHQGNYSCVYGVYVFSHNFSSESRLLSLTVKVLETRMNAIENAVEELKIQSADMMTRLKICENEVEELKRQNADQPKVAFSLGLTDDRLIGPFNTDITLKFSKVITNFGRVYSPTTGVFTAPVRGAYYFSFNILDTRSNTWRDVYLYHNNKRVLTSHNYSVHSGESVSNSLVLQLEKGDVVYLVLAAGHTVYDDGNDHTFFNGFLLFPL